MLNLYSGLTVADLPSSWSSQTIWTQKTVPNINCGLSPSTCFRNDAGAYLTQYFAGQVGLS